MKFREYRPIPFARRHRPMLWGAVSCRIVAGWLCPHCDKKTKKRGGVHTYIDGDEACSDCAREWCESVWLDETSPPPWVEPEPSGRLFDLDPQ